MPMKRLEEPQYLSPLIRPSSITLHMWKNADAFEFKTWFVLSSLCSTHTCSRTHLWTGLHSGRCTLPNFSHLDFSYHRDLMFMNLLDCNLDRKLLRDLLHRFIAAPSGFFVTEVSCCSLLSRLFFILAFMCKKHILLIWKTKLSSFMLLAICSSRYNFAHPRKIMKPWFPYDFLMCICLEYN